MERVARGFVIGVAVGGTTFVMVKANNMVLNILADVNTKVIMALLRLVRSPPRENCDVDWKHICDACDCSDDCCVCDCHWHCSCQKCKKQ